MSPLYTYNNKLLVSGGALAASANCCCESSSSSSGSNSSSGTDGDISDGPFAPLGGDNFVDNNNFEFNNLLSKSTSSLQIEICGLYSVVGEEAFTNTIDFDGFIKVFRLTSINNPNCSIIGTALLGYSVVGKEVTITLKVKLTCNNSDIYRDEELLHPIKSIDFVKILGKFPINSHDISIFGNHQLIQQPGTENNFNANVNWTIN